MSKHQKPTDYDIHFKYLCHKCGQEHWLSLREAKTEDYKVVCFCDHVFSVRPITGIKIKYKEKNSTNDTTATGTTKTKQNDTPTIPLQLYNDAIGLLVGYGFTPTEAKDMIKNAYILNPVDDYKLLVKTILSSLEITHDS